MSVQGSGLSMRARKASRSELATRFAGSVHAAGLTRREKDALIASIHLQDQDPRFLRKLGGRLGVSEKTAKRYLSAGRRKLRAIEDRGNPEEIADISYEMRAVCRKLQLDPRLVRRICLTNKAATVELYKLDDGGNKYMGADGVVATSIHMYPVVA